MGGPLMGGRGSRGRALPQVGFENGIATPTPTQQVDRSQAPADRIRDAYTQLLQGAAPGELVSLAQLRDTLPEISRDELDQTLLAMDRNREVQLEPDPHRIALTQRAKDAAIWLGGEYMHLVTINPPRQDTP